MGGAVCIIPARGGSQRIPRKNIRDFHGKPIIAYSIEAAHASGLFDVVLVTTDDYDIVAVADLYGADVLMRPAGLCRNEVGTQEVTAHALKTFNVDYACCLYATAPLMDVEDLKLGLAFVREGACYAIAVGTEPLRDIGQFYWGATRYFVERYPLIAPRTAMIPVDEARCCDINTEDDWQRAELQYAALHSGGSAPSALC